MSRTNKYDVVVVGGGPAGTTAAYLLARQGYDVCLLDKKDFPRPKLCAGLITWKTVHFLERVFHLTLPELKARGIVIHACRDYIIRHLQGELARGRLKFPFHFVDRKSYDHLWLRTAKAAGVRVFTNCTVTAVDSKAGQVILSDGNRIHAAIIIGADGAWSTVRRSVFCTPPFKGQWRNQLAMTIETSRPCTVQQPPPGSVSLHFGFVPWGYAWSFPSSTHQIVGICALPNKENHTLAKNFRAFLASINVNEDQVTAFKGHPLPYGNYLTRPGRGCVLLAGDACGLADPLLGEGIYYAHRSAELIAQAIKTTAPDFNKVDSIYNRLLGRHILRELRWLKFYRNLLFAGGRRRRFRGLKLFFRLMPRRIETAVQGQISFAKLIWP